MDASGNLDAALLFMHTTCAGPNMWTVGGRIDYFEARPTTYRVKLNSINTRMTRIIPTPNCRHASCAAQFYIAVRRCLLLQTQVCAVAELPVLRICAPHSACRPSSWVALSLASSLPSADLSQLCRCSRFAHPVSFARRSSSRALFSLARSRLQVTSLSLSVPTITPSVQP